MASPLLAAVFADAEVITPKIDNRQLLSEADPDLYLSGNGDYAVVHAPTVRDALYFAYLGSAGNTRAELADALGLPLELPEDATVELQHDGMGVQDVWIQPGYGWLESFDRVTRRDFNFTYQTYDFINADGFYGELAAKEIPAYIEDETRLVFASVGESSYGWREAPALSMTAPGLFVYGNGRVPYEQVVDFICMLGEFLHYEEETFQVVGIPLSGNRTLFAWLPNHLIDSDTYWDELITFPNLEYLPDPGWSLYELFDNLTPEFVRATVAKMEKRQIEVRLPMVRLSSSNTGTFGWLYVAGKYGDFTNLQTGTGSAYIESFRRTAALDLNASGVMTSSVATLAMHLSEFPTSDYGMIGFDDRKDWINWRIGRQALALEFNADRPHVLMIADDAAEDLVAVASVPLIPDVSVVKGEKSALQKAMDWTPSLWFGWLLNNPKSQYVRPWYFHAEHGWIYMPEIKAAGTWWYDEALGWAWSSATFMPWIYSDAHGWLWFAGGVAGERSFYSFEKSGWILEEALRAE